MKRNLIGILLVILVFYSTSVSAIIVPSSNIKTVEFFIAQNPNTVANITSRQYNFSFYIPENTPVKRYAWIELQGVSAGLFDNNININISNNASEILSLDSAGETQRYVIRYPFYPQITTGLNGPYNLNVRVSGSGSNTSLESAKLIITYEYDSTSPRQLKTVKYFVGQNDSKPLNGTNVAFPFSITVPESGSIDVRSAFLEFEGISNGTRDNFILVNTTSATTISHELKGTVATQQFVILYNASELYSITSAGEFGYLANIRGNLATVSAANARAVVTYEYDSNATNQQRTVRYLVASNNSSAIASGTVRAYNFSVPIAENNVQVQSAFIKFSGWITAVNSNVIMNISNTDTKNISIGIDTEGSGFSVLYNATQLYNMTTGVNGPYIFRTRIIGAATTVPMAELYLTYNYSANSPVQMKTVEYAAFNDDMQRTAAFDFDQRFMFIIPETNISAKSVFLETNSITSGTAAHTLSCSLQGLSVNYPQGNSGETTFDYILHNANMTEVFNLSEGVNGAYQFSKGDSAVASLTGAKAVATFFFSIASGPRWSDPLKNDTTVSQNEWIMFNTTWDDDFGLKQYIFSINQSGNWVNSSTISFSGTTNTSSNITQITASSGTVSWRFYAKDRHGNWNETDVQTFNVGGSVGTLNITLLSPAGSNNQPVNQTFVLYANITCIGSPGDSCGNVNGTLMYNATEVDPNTVVQGGVFATPFYALEDNPLTCGLLSATSEPCALNWTVNATGALNSMWKLAVNASSDSVSAKISDNSTISIIDNTLSISISDELARVSFGTTLNPNTQNNSAVNNSNNGYSIVCTYTGGNCNISIKGNGDLVSGANVLGITNVSWNQNNSLNGKQKLSLVYVPINQSLQNLVEQFVWFWLDIPSTQVAGTYGGNFTIQGQAN